MTVRVKICGITRKEDLDAAAAAGADAVGFVVGVASSPRNLSLSEAERLIRQVPPFVKSVLVTVPRGTGDLATYKKLNPDIIQIHGDNLHAESLRLKLPNTMMIRGVNAQVANDLDAVSKASKLFDAVLLDSFVEGRYGGTGMVHDWELSRRVKQVVQPKPLILAGVELQPGIKSHKKVVEFIRNAKGC